MKKGKTVCCFFSVLLLFTLFGCTKDAAEKEQIIGGADTKTRITIEQTQPEESLSSEVEDTVLAPAYNSNAYTPKISENAAQEIGKTALKQEYADSGLGYTVSAFACKSTELHAPQESAMAFNTGRSSQTDNQSGHPYWVVTFFYTESLCDHAYYCIDAETGDVLYSGFYGD